MSASNSNHSNEHDHDDAMQPTKNVQNPKKRQEIVHQFKSTGMTPSIITTINNTNPTPLVNNSHAFNGSNNNNNPNNGASHFGNNNFARTNRRNNEPYESYIEDSFVGHWEHEDDGYEYQDEGEEENLDGCAQIQSDLQHPSTIEFDFDSFGPESIIYNPTNASHSKFGSIVNSNPTVITTTTRPSPLAEVSPEAEKADESQYDISDQHSTEETATDVDNSQCNQPTVDLIRQTRALTIDNNDNLVDLSRIDLKVIEPYKKVISHAGYCHCNDPNIPGLKPGESAPAVIVFSACYLPDRSRRDYNYVMDHIFLYVLSSLHELIADDYILIYLHNTQPYNRPSKSSESKVHATSEIEGQCQNNLPTFNWIKRCYQMIDRKLRKNLKILYLVKPTFWLKTIVIMCKPFISSKFSKKLRFVGDMEELRKCLPIHELTLPASADNI